MRAVSCRSNRRSCSTRRRTSATSPASMKTMRPMLAAAAQRRRLAAQRDEVARYVRHRRLRRFAPSARHSSSTGCASSSIAATTRRACRRSIARRHIARRALPRQARGARGQAEQEPPPGTTGIGHTRWATHGRPSDENAHPHKVGPVASSTTASSRTTSRCAPSSTPRARSSRRETDTEIFAHLVDAELAGGGAAILDGPRCGKALATGARRLRDSSS